MIDSHASNAERIHLVGYGALGREIATQLLAAGRSVKVIQRSRPKDLPEGAEFASADVMDQGALIAATRGAAAIICALGLPYFAEVWEEGWPLAMTNILAACEAHGVRLVYADNLYLYGPQNRPLTADLPPVDYGRKPRSRAVATRLWQAVHASGRVQAVAVRAPDLYGPGVVQSALGVASLQALAEGRVARLLGKADVPHDAAHISDFARAVITLLDAPSDAYGRAWHVPTDTTRTLRQHLQIAADALGVPLRLSVIPGWLARVIGLFVPFVREGIEMQFLFDRPYIVVAEDLKARFWSDPVKFEIGIAEAARSFRAAAQRNDLASTASPSSSVA
ncbi:MAG: NAD-dependent epimerase/dehydratase family protein [Devosia sp.]